MENTGDGSNFLAAVYRELARARTKHGPMHSHHEAWGVIQEELDEVWDEVKRQLAANDGVKGGWKKAHWFNLYRCMVMEKAELLNALEALDSVLAKLAAFDDRFEGGELLSRIDADEDELLRQLDTAKRDVLQEAADVSNYAMMIADVCGALPATYERGR